MNTRQVITVALSAALVVQNAVAFAPSAYTHPLRSTTLFGAAEPQTDKAAAVAAGAIIDEAQLNKVRGKNVALHSDIIKSFLDDSSFGKAVLRELFDLVDTDDSGYLDKEELAVALDLLGFNWLGERQVNKIFERVDADGNREISEEEFMEETPKILKESLQKLARKKGNDM